MDYLHRKKIENEELKSDIKQFLNTNKTSFKRILKLDLSKKYDIFEKEYKEWKSGNQTARETMKHLDLKSNTFYRRVKEFESEVV